MEQNELYPVFLKVHQLDVLIVGGGKVALEKASFLLKSSPNAKLTMVALAFDDAVKELANKYEVPLISAAYDKRFLAGRQVVIGATNHHEVNRQIYEDAKQRLLLVNIADTPDLCDFYLGGIVTKGHVKIAISTNGKSPTMAKRLRQFFEAVIPDDINDLVENLNQYRSKLKGDFDEKVTSLNELTKSIIYNEYR